MPAAVKLVGRPRRSWHFAALSVLLSAGAVLSAGGAGAVGGAARVRAKGAPSAAAPFRWSVQQGFRLPADDLAAVACPTTTICFAGGSTESNTGVLYESATGGQSWANDTAAIPAGVAVIDSLACPGAEVCVAVGWTVSNQGAALRWNGTTWSSQALPSGSIELRSVSCLPTSCQAVGEGSSHAVAFGWSSKTGWVNEALNSHIGTLDDVSCSSPSACDAEGGSLDGAPVVLAWTGATWMTESLPPTSADVSGLGAVACPSGSPSPASCQFVGDGNSAEGIAFSFDGTTWTSESVPAGVATILDVSCPTASACLAIGSSLEGAALTLTLSGATWTSATLSSTDALSDISCATATSCQAVGNGVTASTGPVAFSWNGAKWASEAIAPSIEELLGISCRSVSSCQTVGDNLSGGVALSWNGATWTNDALSNAWVKLENVTCPATNSCVASGLTEVAGSPEGAYFNGAAWTAVPLPTGVRLGGMSCASIAMCIGAGMISSGGVTLLWNGKSWTKQTTFAASTLLNGVSCVTASFCQLVGSSPGAPVAYEWNGKSWTREALPAGLSSLTSVSCASTTGCQAIADSNTAGATALGWNGKAWASEGALSGVDLVHGLDCVSARECQAVGAGKPGAVALAWNGTNWVEEALPAGLSGVDDVSCVPGASGPGDLVCRAVGYTAALVEILTGQGVPA